MNMSIHISNSSSKETLGAGILFFKYVLSDGSTNLQPIVEEIAKNQSATLQYNMEGQVSSQTSLVYKKDQGLRGYLADREDDLDLYQTSDDGFIEIPLLTEGQGKSLSVIIVNEKEFTEKERLCIHKELVRFHECGHRLVQDDTTPFSEEEERLWNRLRKDSRLARCQGWYSTAKEIQRTFESRRFQSCPAWWNIYTPIQISDKLSTANLSRILSKQPFSVHIYYRLQDGYPHGTPDSRSIRHVIDVDPDYNKTKVSVTYSSCCDGEGDGDTIIEGPYAYDMPSFFESWSEESRQFHENFCKKLLAQESLNATIHHQDFLSEAEFNEYREWSSIEILVFSSHVNEEIEGGSTAALGEVGLTDPDAVQEILSDHATPVLRLHRQTVMGSQYDTYPDPTQPKKLVHGTGAQNELLFYCENFVAHMEKPEARFSGPQANSQAADDFKTAKKFSGAPKEINLGCIQHHPMYFYF